MCQRCFNAVKGTSGTSTLRVRLRTKTKAGKKLCKTCKTVAAQKALKFEGMCVKCYNASKGYEQSKTTQRLCKICNDTPAQNERKFEGMCKHASPRQKSRTCAKCAARRLRRREQNLQVCVDGAAPPPQARQCNLQFVSACVARPVFLIDAMGRCVAPRVALGKKKG